MNDYDDLFKTNPDNIANSNQHMTQPDPDLTIDQLTREYKVNVKLVLVYVGIMLLASLFQFAYFRTKFPSSTDIDQIIEVSDHPEVVFSASTDLNYPYQVTITGSLKNIWSKPLPRIWVEVDFLNEQGKAVSSLAIESDQIASGETYQFSETQLLNTTYSDWEIHYGYDESSLFYVVLHFSQMAIIAILFVWIDKWSLKRDWQSFRERWQSGIGQICYGIFILYVVSIMAQAFLVYVLGMESGSENEQVIASMFTNNPLNLILLFLLLCIFTPLVEELIYRKVLFRFVDRRFGSTAAIITSGLVFGLMHVISYGDFLQAIPYVFMGMVFGWVYHRSKNNIFVTSGMHFVNNFITFLIYFIAVLS